MHSQAVEPLIIWSWLWIPTIYEWILIGWLVWLNVNSWLPVFPNLDVTLQNILWLPFLNSSDKHTIYFNVK